MTSSSLIGAGNARQQGLHMLPGLPRAGTTRGFNAISPCLLCPNKVIRFSQYRSQHLIGSRIIRVETHDLAQRLGCLSPVLQFVLFTGQAVPDHCVFRLLGEHCGEGFDFRLDHRFVLNHLDSTDPLKVVGAKRTSFADFFSRGRYSVPGLHDSLSSLLSLNLDGRRDKTSFTTLSASSIASFACDQRWPLTATRTNSDFTSSGDFIDHLAVFMRRIGDAADDVLC